LANQAVTCLERVILSEHDGRFEAQPSFQRANLQPADALAFSVTFLALRTDTEHRRGQLMPAALVTCPLPLTLTLRVGAFASPAANASVAVASATPGTIHATRMAAW
jgi:hypothetical protein